MKIIEIKYAPLTSALGGKLPKYTILVGSDKGQVRLAQRLTGAEPHFSSKVEDGDFLGKESFLCVVDSSFDVHVSSDVAAGVFSIAPLVPGSSGLKYLVRYAAKLVKVKPTEDLISEVEESIASLSTDASALMVYAMQACLSPSSLEKTKDPWESPEWARCKNIDNRLAILYKDLNDIVKIHSEIKTDLQPSEIKKFERLNLPLDKVFKSLITLSKWRIKNLTPYSVSLCIQNIWR